MKICFVVLFAGLLFSRSIQATEAIPEYCDDRILHLSAGGVSAVPEASITEIRQLMDRWAGDSSRRPDAEGWNWAAGLTAYLTSYLNAEQKGEGWQFRKSILTEYTNYVRSENDVPLREIVRTDNGVSRAIVSGKGGMVFHMLRGVTGDEAFFNALKRLMNEHKFDETSWDVVRAVFEQASGEKLDWFFSQWLDRKGMPEIEITTPRVVVLKGVNTVSFEVLQKAEPYRLHLPVKIETDKDEIARVLNITGERETFEIPVDGTPLEIVFDENYDVFRRLSDNERPPVISGLLGDEERLLIIPGEKPEKYGDFQEALKKEGFAVKEESQMKDDDIRTHSLLVFGFDNLIIKRLFGYVGKPDSGFSLSVRRNPINPEKVIAIVQADTKEEIPPFREITDYHGCSFVRFKSGKERESSVAETAQGLRFNLYTQMAVIRPQNMMRIEETIEAFLDKPVIYVGERHTAYEDHKVQMKVIMSLHEKGRKFAVGMEMFQRSVQKVIDDYLSGAISEKEFLKRTQYFKRWGFDYNLYREIVEYAKAKGIPVIALNLSAEIVKKVSAEGIDSLTDAERDELPDSMDMSDDDYRERLKEVFKQHKTLENKSFENFYQAQILWDETMARSVDGFLRKNPDYQMVVLAGSGHVIYGSGIPKRAYRLNPKEYAIILPFAESVDKDMGDYLVSTQPVIPPTTLKLGVILMEKDGRVVIEKVVPGSIAKSAGLKKGDILVSLDDWKIEDIGDVNIFMVDKKRGDPVTINILRKRFLTGYKELTLAGTI